MRQALWMQRQHDLCDDATERPAANGNVVQVEGRDEIDRIAHHLEGVVRLVSRRQPQTAVVEGNYAQSVASERIEKRRVPIVQIAAESGAHDDRLAGAD